MTRWARGTDSNKKKALEGSSWDALKPPPQESQQNIRHDRKKNNFLNKTHKNGKGFKSNKHKGKYSEMSMWKQKFKNSKDREEQELAETMWKQQRSENRRLQRIREREAKRVCFNCREPGHNMADCPELRGDADQGTGICFKCGSTEHQSAQCTAKIKPGTYPFAKCFICGEMGHITKQCPDNPRGLYPNGGCCKMCGSVEHFKKDCPKLQKQQGIADVKIGRINQGSSVDADVTEKQDNSPQPTSVKKKPKVVKF